MSNAYRYEWIETLRKADLQTALRRYNLNSDGLVPVLRERLRNFMMYGPASGSGDAPVDLPNVLPPRPLSPDIRVLNNSNPFREASLDSDDEVSNHMAREEFPLRNQAPRVRRAESPVLAPQREPAPVAPPVASIEKIRSWNLRFDGRGEPELFLERLNELRTCFDVTNDQLYRALPELLTRDALTWYRNNQRHFDDWDSFLDVWCDYYLPTDYYDRLEESIARTRQGPTENGRDYVAHMQTKFRRYGRYTVEKELRLLYGNLRPEYRQYINRAEVTSIPALIHLIDEYEKLRDEIRWEHSKRERTPETRGAPARETGQNTSRIVCYNCRQPGHISRNCSLPRQGNAHRAAVPEVRREEPTA